MRYNHFASLKQSLKKETMLWSGFSEEYTFSSLQDCQVWAQVQVGSYGSWTCIGLFVAVDVRSANNDAKFY